MSLNGASSRGSRSFIPRSFTNWPIPPATLIGLDGKRYQPRPVRIVQQGGDSALIEGVRPGERVVVSGSAALKAMLAGVGKS